MNKQLINLAKETLTILEKKSWDLIIFDEIIKKTKINTKILDVKILKKHDLLSNINRYFDSKLNKASYIVDQSSRKDMVFEMMMLRFDILQTYRKSITKIFESFRKKPRDLIFLLPSFIESMILIANLSHISIDGIKGNLKVKGLLIVYFSSFLVCSMHFSSCLVYCLFYISQYYAINYMR